MHSTRRKHLFEVAMLLRCILPFVQSTRETIKTTITQWYNISSPLRDDRTILKCKKFNCFQHTGTLCPTKSIVCHLHGSRSNLMQLRWDQCAKRSLDRFYQWQYNGRRMTPWAGIRRQVLLSTADYWSFKVGFFIGSAYATSYIGCITTATRTNLNNRQAIHFTLRVHADLEEGYYECDPGHDSFMEDQESVFKLLSSLMQRSASSFMTSKCDY